MALKCRAAATACRQDPAALQALVDQIDANTQRLAEVVAKGEAETPQVAPDLYPALGAVFRSALISFCAQISAAPATGSVLPGIVNQPLFTSMSPR